MTYFPGFGSATMSDATKIVVGTVGTAGFLSVVLIVALAV